MDTKEAIRHNIRDLGLKVIQEEEKEEQQQKQKNILLFFFSNRVAC
jgi:hypothetical protein